MASPEALQYFTNTSALSRQKTQAHLARFKDHCRTHGVANEDIIKLIRSATSGVFDAAVSCQLVQCLLPLGEVSVDSVYYAISTLCSGKGCDDVQVLLLEWLVLVHQYVRSDYVFSQLYGIAFQLLERPHLLSATCHLLYLTTGHANVTPYHVNKLVSLHDKYTGSEQEAVSGLLYLYKRHRPCLVFIDLSSLDDEKVWRAFTFSASQGVWAGNMSRVQLAASMKTAQGSHFGKGLTTQDEGPTSGVSCIPSTQMSLKRKHSSPAELSSLSEHGREHGLQGDVSLPSLSGSCFSVFSCLDGARMHSPMKSSTLDAPAVLQMSSRSDPVARLRLSSQLRNIFLTDFLCGRPQSSEQVERGSQVLRAVGRLTEYLTEALPVVEDFLETYLATWDGSVYRDEVLELLSYIRLRPFDELYAAFLQPLEQLYQCASLEDKARLIHCWRRMFCNFVKVEVARTKREKLLRHGHDDSRLPAGGCSTEVNAKDVIARLIVFVDHISFVGLEAEHNSPLLQQAALRFFHSVESLALSDGVSYIPFPSPSTSYRLLLSRNAATVSGLCLIYSRLFKSMSVLMKREWHYVADWQQRARVTHMFNRIVLDIVAMLFKGDLFPSNVDRHGAPSIFQLTWKSVMSLQLDRPPSDSITLFRSIAFLGASRHFRLQQQKQSPDKGGSGGLKTLQASPPSVHTWEDRGKYVQYLKLHHFEGIDAFQSVFLSPPR